MSVCGMWRFAGSLQRAEASASEGLVLYRKRKPFKWTGTVTLEASIKTTTLTIWSLVLL